MSWAPEEGERERGADAAAADTWERCRAPGRLTAAPRVLRWAPETSFEAMIAEMVTADVAALRR